MSFERNALVVGGAGKFGSELTGLLASYGWKVVVFDSLITSTSGSVTDGPLVKADVRESPRILRTLKEYKITRVFYCAMTEPDSVSDRWDQLLSGVMSVLHSLKTSETKELTVFMPKDETAAMTERLMQDCAAVIGVKVRTISWADDALTAALA